MTDDGLVGHLGLGSNVQASLKWLMVILKFPILKFVPKCEINGCTQWHVMFVHLRHVHSSQFSITCILNFTQDQTFKITNFRITISHLRLGWMFKAQVTSLVSDGCLGYLGSPQMAVGCLYPGLFGRWPFEYNPTSLLHFIPYPIQLWPRMTRLILEGYLGNVIFCVNNYLGISGK